MKFALFYEIPVARPWHPLSEYQAYQNTIAQAVLGDQMGFDAFWTVEHHFLEEYSHCSNPEVLYGAVAALTKNIRLGYGVRLMPKPYNHPVRSAESAAVLDVISGGRVDFGTGRSSTRAEMEGFDLDPSATRGMWQEAIEHIVGCWTNEEHEFNGEHWSLPKRRVLPKPLQKPHPPIWGATSSVPTHEIIGRLGLGLCSFAVGVTPDDVRERVDAYRKGLAECTQPLGKFVNDNAATFSMVCCAPTTDEAIEVARESFEWYPRYGAKLIASVAEWMEEKSLADASYSYTQDARTMVKERLTDYMTMEYMCENSCCVVGDPDDCIRLCQEYEAAGVDMLLCLVNPYKISHDKVMQTIRMMGESVLPAFRRGDNR